VIDWGGAISIKGNNTAGAFPYRDLLAGQAFNLAGGSARRNAKPASDLGGGESARQAGAACSRHAGDGSRGYSSSFITYAFPPGMLHGVVIRPPAPGATLAGIDERSIRGECPASSRSQPGRELRRGPSPENRGRRGQVRTRSLKVSRGRWKPRVRVAARLL
jgi:hypothetical protein